MERIKASSLLLFAAVVGGLLSLSVVFIGGTIAQLIAPIGGIEGLFIWWGLFAASCIPGSIIGFIILLALKRANISRVDFFEE